MTSNKSGRVRCGACRRVLLLAPESGREPTNAERAELDAMPAGLEKGRLLHRLSPPSGAGDDRTHLLPGGDWVLACKCGRRYRPPELARRRIEARGRHEDLYLGSPDLDGGVSA